MSAAPVLMAEGVFLCYGHDMVVEIVAAGFFLHQQAQVVVDAIDAGIGYEDVNAEYVRRIGGLAGKLVVVAGLGKGGGHAEGGQEAHFFYIGHAAGGQAGNRMPPAVFIRLV